MLTVPMCLSFQIEKEREEHLKPRLQINEAESPSPPPQPPKKEEVKEESEEEEEVKPLPNMKPTLRPVSNNVSPLTDEDSNLPPDETSLDTKLGFSALKFGMNGNLLCFMYQIKQILTNSS